MAASQQAALVEPLHRICTATAFAVCPGEAMTFIITPRDVAPQGPGHLGRTFRAWQKQRPDEVPDVQG
jgi:hypothetical protein